MKNSTLLIPAPLREVFRSGRVLKPVKEADHAVIEFNTRLVKYSRAEVVMLPVADGMSLVSRT